MGLNTEGKKVYLYLYNRSGLSQYFGADRRPRLNLYGVWHNPDLVMDDHGSLSSEFEPDGRLYTGHSPHRPATREIVPVALRAGSRADFDAACAAAKIR
jgi:hypothetical protein